MDEKQERTEWISMNVSKAIKNEFEMAKDNKSLQDEIIRRFLKSETEWLENELKDIDEVTIRYRARLIGIKDAFSKAQDSYVKEIEDIYNKSAETFSKAQGVSKLLEVETQKTVDIIKSLAKSIEYIDVRPLERMISVVEKFNSMTIEEKELINLLINKKA